MWRLLLKRINTNLFMQLFSPFHLFFWAGLVCLSAIKGLLSPRWFIYVFDIPGKNIQLISYNVDFNTDLILITFYAEHYIKHIWFKVWTEKFPDLPSFGFILPAKNTETVQTHKIVFSQMKRSQQCLLPILCHRKVVNKTAHPQQISLHS